MKYQISQVASRELRTLYEISRPRIGFADVTDTIIQQFILTKLIWTRNYFQRLQKSGGSTREIVSRSRRNLGRNVNPRCIKKEISRLMSQKIGNISYEIRVQKKKCLSRTTSVEEALNLQARSIFRDIKKRESERVWGVEKKLKLEKLERHRPQIPGEISGIMLEESALRDTFGDPTQEVMILGGIQASDNIKAFLSLPLKFRTYCKPEREHAETEAEARAAKQRWVIRDKNTHGQEDFDAYRRRKERREDAREPLQGTKVDFTNIQVTQLLANKFIHLPNPASEVQEIRMGGEKIKLLDAWDSYIGRNEDDNGRIRGANNLTRAEAEGRREIAQGVKDKNWMLYGTDKSGRLVLDTRANFLECMKPHYEGDRVISYERVLQSEPLINNHTKAWVKVLNMGMHAGDGQPRRIQEALKVTHSNVAHLKGFRKDHKRTPDPTIGPPLRPVADGKVGPNAPLANLMTRLLKPVREGIHKKVPTEILSTEEALHLIEKFNNEVGDHVARVQPTRANKTPPMQTGSIQVGSMDVTAL